MKLRYRELQIIKHSLQHYLNRDNASENDIVRESNLLKKVTNEIDEMKEKYEIK
jgi:hypothetical protein